MVDWGAGLARPGLEVEGGLGMKVNRVLTVFLMAITVLFYSIPVYCYGQDEVVIHSYLMRGFREKVSGVPIGQIAKPGSAPLHLRVSPDSALSLADEYSLLRKEIAEIYRIPRIVGLKSSVMIWNGREDCLCQAVLSLAHLYQFQLHFRKVDTEAISLRLDGTRYRFGEIRYLPERATFLRGITYGDFELFSETREIAETIGGETWLNTDFDLPFGTPVVVALPGMDAPYFLAFLATRKDARQFSAGIVGTKLDYFNVSDADPVCGKIVGRGDGINPDEKALASLTYNGYTFMFCSESCLSIFRNDPDGCLKRSNTEYYTLVNCPDPGSPANYAEVRGYKQDMSNLASAFPKIIVRPRFPESGADMESRCIVQTEIRVSASGDVIEIKTLEPSSKEHEEATRSALHQWKFEPKNWNDLPYSLRLDIDFDPSSGRPASVITPSIPQATDLGEILNKAASYCGQLEEAALSYVCWEGTREKIFAKDFFLRWTLRRMQPRERGGDLGLDPRVSMSDVYRGTKSNGLCDYQLIREGNRVFEQRIPLDEQGRPMKNPALLSEPKRVYFHKPIYGPIGLMAKNVQQFYQYTLLGDEKIIGRLTSIIEARPIRPIPGRPNYGKLWIDKLDGSVLKMQVEAESLEGYERIQEAYFDRGVKPLLSVEILFELKKKDLRYPTQILINEAYYDPERGRTNVMQLIAEYDRYKFFTVETDEHIIIK